MKLLTIILSVCSLLSSCQTAFKETKTSLRRSAAYQAEIDAILAEDRSNKEYEEQVLHEINIAIEYGDTDAYRFFLQEYINIPRMVLPYWMTLEPGYKAPVQQGNKKILIRLNYDSDY